MTFGHPLALLWGLLAIPIVLLYRQRVRLRRRQVATGMIWEQVFAEDRARATWQRWRHPVSLAVQLTVLGLIVIALLDVQIPGPRQVVLIVDNSAGMNATDVKPSRLEQAKQTAGRLIETLRPYDSAAVLSVGSAVGVHCNLTGDRATLSEALASISPTTAATRMDAAVALARRMLDKQSGGTIVPLTDGCFEGAQALADAADVELIRVGRPIDNVAIARLQVRRQVADPRQCQVMAEVSFAGQPAACKLRVMLDGKQVATIPVELPPSGSRRQFFDIPAAEAGVLTVELDRTDDFPDDNRVSRTVPPAADVFADATTDATMSASATSAVEWADLGESDLRVPVIGTESAAISGGRPWPAAWLYLAALGVLLLALEWCFYQRRWIC